VAPVDTDLPLPPVQSAAEVVERFLDGSLDRDSWTHAAHLFVCHHLLQTSSGPGETLARLRYLIQAHNERVGLPPGRGGYHETVTRYFVEAVDHAGPASLAALLTEPTCRREAPRTYWSASLLGSDRARQTWAPPDLRPLPWEPARSPGQT
jgi:hypothetical protein